MIKIKESKTADTRTCDWSKVTEQTLMESSVSHIKDVYAGLKFFAGKLISRGKTHDWDKIEDIKGFHSDFQTGFKSTKWWDAHRKINRHHIDNPEGVATDINLVDVIEYVVDCVMAGMARSGSVYDIKLPDELLQKALKNTIEMLKSEVKVEKEGTSETK